MTGQRKWQLAFGAALALLLLSVFLKGVEWKALADDIRGARPGYLAAVVGVTLLMYLARAWRWGFLLAPLARVPVLRLFSITVVGFMTGLLLPRAQEFLRPYLVGRSSGIRPAAAFASIILERLLDVIAVLILFGLYLYVLPPPPVQTSGPLLRAATIGGGFAALLALVALGLLLAFHAHAERVVGLLEGIFKRLPFGLGRLASEALRSFGAGLGVLRAPPGHLLAMLGQSFVLWLLISATVFFANRAFELDLPFHASFLIIAFLVVGVMVPTPDMVGGYHEAYKVALTQVYGVEPARAAAVALTAHALTNLPVLLLGLFLLRREGLTIGKVAQMTEETSKEPLGAEARP